MRFRANAAQRRYDNIRAQGVVRDIDAKVRKWGLSTRRLALGLHGTIYRRGRNGVAVAQAEDPAKELAGVVRQLYESAWEWCDWLIRECGWRDITPAYFLPRNTSDSVYGYKFGDIKSQYRVMWAGARGLGRLVNIHDLYITELAEWEGRVEDAVASLLSAVPPGASDAVVTIDFNAHSNWRSSYAFEMWERANLPTEHPDWNGFTPFFVGTDDLPEYYTPDFLAAKRRELGERRFKLNYPRVVEDLYVQHDVAVHAQTDIDAAYQRTGGRYLFDVLSRSELERVYVVHGVDTATGMLEGDYQSCVSFGWHDGMWWELCPPIHERVPEDVFAQHIDERVRAYPGTCVVERNVGSAVLIALRQLGTTGLYKHKHRDKDGRQRRQLGFPTTYGTKRQMIAEGDEMLRAGELGLVTDDLRAEWRDVEWKTNSDGTEAKGLAGAPDVRGKHDDLWMASLLALQGQNYNTSGEWAA